MAGKLARRRVYGGKRWRTLRLEVFKRDGWKCQKCGRRAALECDHRVPVSDGGSWFEMNNLRTLCRSCHIEVGRAHATTPSAERVALTNLREAS